MKQILLTVLAAWPFFVSVGCGGSGSTDGASAGASGGAGASGSAGSSVGSAGSNAGMSGSDGSTAGAAGRGGGSSAEGGSGGASGSSAGAGGAQSCGTTICAANQYCVVPCCGGTAPLCFDPPDGGACPNGATKGCVSGASYNCANAANCCEPAPCKPPAPYCSDTMPSGGCLLEGRTCHLECA